tara:strand:- start:188 stop:370 length:183 start_codon:yes stop_codon:yes gene_type:complete
MEKGNTKTYKVEFLEEGQMDKQVMTIKTNDIKWTVDQIGRNRLIDGDIKYKEVRVQIEDE